MTNDAQGLAEEGKNFISQRKGESDAAFKKRKKAFLIAMRKRQSKMKSGARGSDYK